MNNVGIEIENHDDRFPFFLDPQNLPEKTWLRRLVDGAPNCPGGALRGGVHSGNLARRDRQRVFAQAREFAGNTLSLTCNTVLITWYKVGV